MIIFKEKTYTRWDDTDQLKKMRDSDILAERKKSGTLGNTAAKMGLGTVAGGVLGSVAGGVLGARSGKGIVSGMKKGAVAGSLIGGATVGTAAAIGNSGKQAEINHYNNRLAYAQRQAARRERADWKGNMTGREGYTY